MTTAKRVATYEDVLNAPENMVAEIINGDLELQPRPSMGHAQAGALLSSELVNRFWRGNGGPGGWIILTEPELHLSRDILVPDLAGWRRERMPELPNDAFTTLAPDWVCEILSPSTAAKDRKAKMAIYAREEVKHAWLLDPSARTLEVYRLESSRWVQLAVHSDDDRVRAEPFDAIELHLAPLWAGIAPPTAR